MSTNYYARILPSKERKKELHDAIDADDFSLINTLTSELYGGIRMEWSNNSIVGGEVHLGKKSSGWKFLWNPNIFVERHWHYEDNNGVRTCISDPSTPIYTYPLTKKGIKEFIDREDVLIYDEYNELQDKEEFWQYALKNNKDDWDSASYEENKAGTMYPVEGELTDLLIQEGYKFTSHTNADFYSDGLRFAGFTEFS